MIFAVLTHTKVCLHIHKMDMLTYQVAKCSLTFYQHYSFTPDQFKKKKKNFAYVRLVRRAPFIYTYFSKNFVCVNLGGFSSKKCKLSFLFRICKVVCMIDSLLTGQYDSFSRKAEYKFCLGQSLNSIRFG